jgi:PAS domain S-box-containing protein
MKDDTRTTLTRRAHALGLADQAPVAMIVTDRDGNIATWNAATEELLGWPRAEVANCPIARLAVPRSRAAVNAVVEEAGRGRTMGLDVELQDSHGRHRSIHLRGAPLFNSTGQLVGVLLAALNTREWLEQESEEARAHELGLRLARARREAGLTQQELADRLKVTRRSVQGYEAGAVVPYRRLRAIAELLDRPAQWFLTGDEPEAVAGESLRRLLREELPEIIKDAAQAPAA